MSVYAVSDLHGRYDLWAQIKDFLKEDDVLYVLGDCADRGKHGWDIIKEVYEDPRFIYIKGNHEEMFTEAMRGDRTLCFYNGGKPTYKAWRYKEGAPMEWYRRLKDLPLEQVYVNTSGKKIIMCHAGYTPMGQQLWGDDYLWDRTHFDEEWNMDYDDTIVVHGHTPIPYMGRYLCGEILQDLGHSYYAPGVFWYSRSKGDGQLHKVNIDCGAVFLGQIAILNLDTLEQTIFFGEDYKSLGVEK